MPQSTHDRVAELANHAEHVHDKAAVSKGQQDHLTGAELHQDGEEKARETKERVEKLLHHADEK